MVLNSQFATLTEAGLLLALKTEEARQAEQSTGPAFTARGLRGGRGGSGDEAGQDGGQDGYQSRAKVLGRDGAWGKLGWAPAGHCHGCHKKGHRWDKCRKRPGDAVPDCVQQKQGKGKSGGDAHAAEGDRGSDYGELAMATCMEGIAEIPLAKSTLPACVASSMS